MVTVIILDDEPLIREGLVDMMDWDKLGCKVIGQGENGIEGMDLVKELKPDIVITDIMMPGVDGITLTKYITDNYPNTQVIILTGYDEFSFAQGAVKAGAADFILKPTRIEELEKIILAKKEIVLKNKQKDKQQEELKKKLEISLPVLQYKFVSDLLYGIVNDAREIKNKMELFGVSFKICALLIIEIDGYHEIKEKYTQQQLVYYHLQIEDILKDIAKENALKVLIFYHDERLVTIPYLDMDNADLKEFEKIIDDTANKLAAYVRNSMPFTVSIGVSSICNDISHVRVCYREAQDSLQNKFYIGGDFIFHYTKMEEFINHFPPALKISDRYLDAVKEGDEKRVEKELDFMMQSLKNIKDEAYIRNFCMCIISETYRIYFESFQQGDHFSLDNSFFVYDKLMACDTIDNLFKTVKISALNIAAEIKKRYKDHRNYLMYSISNYIEQNYSRDLTLQEMADQFYLSQGHLSRMIKKLTGKTFTEMLTDIRMEKAKALLKDPRYKVYEISKMVGFTNSRYFGQLFKKILVVLPLNIKRRLLLANCFMEEL